ncbi:hypothetical protein [Haloterrigena salifodinae]|uniref:hypothetical protein n=1 Tax=Haloterrigena salifodinae TaxID=2675099 RepID=UPI001B871402|nr:hypothetical protein [Haloterrigena salifodinae]
MTGKVTTKKDSFFWDWRVAVSTALVLLTVPIIFITILSPTSFYRDVYFYADEYMIRQIISHGEVQSNIHMYDNPNIVLDNWGKIATREKLPVLPILLSQLSLVTNLPANLFYIAFPGYIFITLCYFLFFRKIFDNMFLATILSVLGSLAPNIPVNYTMNITIAANGIILLSVYLLYRIISKDSSFVTPMAEIVSLCIFSTALFFWYPPHFGVVLSVLLVIFLLSFFIDTRQVVPLLIPISICILTFIQIFEIPLSTYIHYIQISIVRVVSLNIGSPVSGQTSPIPTAIQPQYYSLIPLIILIPLGGYGGVIALKHTLAVLQHQKFDLVPVIAISWGFAILGIALFYLSSGEAFLTGRPFQLSIPVIMLGTAFGLNRVSSKSKIWACLVLLVLALLMVSSFYLQSSDMRNDIQTYGAGAEESGKWTSSYAQGRLISDIGSGAPSASSGYLNIVHPDNSSELSASFYSSNHSEYNRYIHSKDASGSILSSRMYNKGIFALGLPQRPTDRHVIESRRDQSNTVYSNGNYWIVYNR